MRQLLFFLAFTITAKALFGEVNAWLEAWRPVATLDYGVRELAVHLPYAVVAGLLLTHAQIWSRLPANYGWYALLALLSAAQLLAPHAIAGLPPFPAPAVPFLTLALLAAIVMVHLRLLPKPGFIYEGSSFPGVRAFIALTLLLALSIDFAPPLLALPGAGSVAERMPAMLVNVIVCALIVSAFISASGVRFRMLQPNPAGPWLVAGIVAFVAAELVQPTGALLKTYGLAGEPFAAALIVHAAAAVSLLRIAAHVLLFVGAFYLLSHLLPLRERGARL